jgi:hypothetical protein
MIIPEVVLIHLSSLGRTHSCSKHAEDSNKRDIEEIVRQVGYLPELYEDARSEKILKIFSSTLFIKISINLLKTSGYVIYYQFNIQQLYAMRTLYLCVLYLSENKQRLVPLTA